MWIRAKNSRNLHAKYMDLNIWRVLAAVPVALLVIAITSIDLNIPYRINLGFWLPLLNTSFSFILSLVIVYMASRAYFQSGLNSLLFLGSGVMAYGGGSFLAGWLLKLTGSLNNNITVFNGAVFLSALLHLGSLYFISQENKENHPSQPVKESNFLISYVGVIIILLLLAWGSNSELLPQFYHPDSGMTVLRYIVLGMATLLMGTSSFLFARLYFRYRAGFYYYYALALMLITMGIVFVLSYSVETAAAWTGRFTQYTGSIYLLFSVLAAARERFSKGNTVEKALADYFIYARENYQAFIDCIIDGMVVFDSRGRILVWNQGAEKIFGYSRKEAMLSLKLEALVSPKYLRRLWKMAADPDHQFWSGDKKLFKLKVMKKAGGATQAEISLSLGLTGGSRVITSIVREISSPTKKKLEKELIKRDKLEAVGLLAGGIAHDFNNILTVIQGNASLANMYARNDDKILEKLQEIKNAVEQAKGLTRQLLTFSKGGEPVKEVILLADLLVETTRFSLSGSNIQPKFIIAHDLLPVAVDKGQFAQVINNMIINADQAMTKGGNIEIRAENVKLREEDGIPLPPGRYVKISIADQGNGIPKEYISKIFDPYFTTKQKGSGIGLASAYSIIKKHQGYINVESNVGEGTVFSIFLPYVMGTVVASKQRTTSPKIGKGKILVMDDEELIRVLTGEMLQHLGYQAELTSDGEKAITAYRLSIEKGLLYDLVILDLTVPGGMGGLETLKNLKNISGEVNAIACSGYSHDLAGANLKENGFKGFLPKPYCLDELAEAIEQVMHKRDMQNNQEEFNFELENAQ